MQIAPLWLMKPTWPGRAIAGANVALSPLHGAITPRQFGPMSRILPRRASASTSDSSAMPRGPDFLESGGNDDGAIDARLDALADDARDRFGRRDNHREIDRTGNVTHAPIGAQLQDGRAFRIHRVERTSELAGEQIREHSAADASRTFGRADHGHRLRTEEHVERAAHRHRAL